MILLTFLTQLSCERDEICLEDITPKLVIRFYNANIPNEFKSVVQLKVNIEGIDGDYSNETITTLTDSIAIPLQVSDNTTRFILTLQGNSNQGTEDNIDTISVRYSQEDYLFQGPVVIKQFLMRQMPVSLKTMIIGLKAWKQKETLYK